MAKKPTTDNTPVDARRVSVIASQIWQTCSGLVKELGVIEEAKDILNEAKDAGISKRETIMGAIAKLSEEGAWTFKEIAAAATAAAKMHNGEQSTAKAMESFINEIKHAAHPLVREHFDALVSIRNFAWDQETEQLDLDKSYPKPLRVAYKRKYHALTMGCMGAAENGVLFQTADELVAHAVAHNPEHDAAKVHKKIMAMKVTLDGYFVEFPCADLAHICDTLAKLTFNDMALAQAERQAELNPVEFVLNTAEVNEPAVDNSPTAIVAASKPTLPVGNLNPARGFSIPVVSETMADTFLDEVLGDNLALSSAA
jgi:hypothetical protein